MKKPSLFICATILSILGNPCFATEITPPKNLSVEKAESPMGEQKKPIPIEDFTISRKGDLQLSCTELFHEAKAMSMVIDETANVKNDSKMQSRGISAAGAVGSFLVGTVTGGIGLAVGGLLLDRSVGNRQEDADKIQDIAEQRRTLMMGIYTAQGCDGDIYAMIEKEHPVVAEAKNIPDIEPAANETAKTGSIPANPYNN